MVGVVFKVSTRNMSGHVHAPPAQIQSFSSHHQAEARLLVPAHEFRAAANFALASSRDLRKLLRHGSRTSPSSSVACGHRTCAHVYTAWRPRFCSKHTSSTIRPLDRFVTSAQCGNRGVGRHVYVSWHGPSSNVPSVLGGPPAPQQWRGPSWRRQELRVRARGVDPAFREKLVQARADVARSRRLTVFFEFFCIIMAMRSSDGSGVLQCFASVYIYPKVCILCSHECLACVPSACPPCFFSGHVTNSPCPKSGKQ